MAQSKHGIFISQHKYVLDLLRDTRKMACKLAIIAIDPNHILGEAEGDKDTDKESLSKISWQVDLSISLTQTWT